MEYYVVHNNMIPMGMLQQALILLRQDHVNNKVYMAEQLKWRECSLSGDFAGNEAFILAPSMGFEEVTPEIRNFLQAMTDAAWKLGIRPREAVDAASELKAVRYHLEDMRVMAKLERAPMPTPLKVVES